MAIASQQQLSVNRFADEATDECSIGDAAPARVTNLAALLDQFTQNVTQPDAHTVGDFAATVSALHGEFAMLAHHFGAIAWEPEVIDFNDIFPSGADAGLDTAGVAADEELEHVCRELSR